MPFVPATLVVTVMGENAVPCAVISTLHVKGPAPSALTWCRFMVTVPPAETCGRVVPAMAIACGSAVAGSMLPPPGVSPKLAAWAPENTVTSDWELPELAVMPRAVPVPPRSPCAEVILQWPATGVERARARRTIGARMECMMVAGGTGACAEGKMREVKTGTSLLGLRRQGEDGKSEKRNAMELNQDNERKKEK